MVAAAVGYTGRNFLADSVDITRWYNRATKAIAGSVIFSSGCEGPPGELVASWPGMGWWWRPTATDLAYAACLLLGRLFVPLLCVLRSVSTVVWHHP